MKIAFILTDWNTNKHRRITGEYGGVGYYRAVKPAESLRKLGHDVDVLGKDFNKEVQALEKGTFDAYQELLKDYDAVVIKQVDTALAPRIIGACKSLYIPIIMDLDDDFMEVDESNPAYNQGYDKGGQKRAFSLVALSMCDGLFASTQALADSMRKHLKTILDIEMPIYVLPNCSVKDEWKIQLGKKKGFTIGWHGSITHDEDLMLALPSIREIMLERPEINLELIGGIRQESVPVLFKDWGELIDRVKFTKGTPSWVGFQDLIGTRNWDIGIAPLKDTKFTRAKSHIKWMEYTLSGIPVIASNTTVYRDKNVNDIIEHRKTGLLCNDNEWKKTLLELIDDEKLRVEILTNAYIKMDEWEYDKNIHLWEKALKNIVNENTD